MVLLQFKQSHSAPPADENGRAPKKPPVRDMLEGPPQPKLYEVGFLSAQARAAYVPWLQAPRRPEE